MNFFFFFFINPYIVWFLAPNVIKYEREVKQMTEKMKGISVKILQLFEELLLDPGGRRINRQ